MLSGVTWPMIPRVASGAIWPPAATICATSQKSTSPRVSRTGSAAAWFPQRRFATSAVKASTAKDRAIGCSTWDLERGAAIDGPLEGHTLEELPLTSV
jgi:hypothetical protein